MASKEAGLKKLPALIRDLTDEEAKLYLLQRTWSDPTSPQSRKPEPSKTTWNGMRINHLKEIDKRDFVY